MKKYFSGVVKDPRSKKQKAKDYQALEVATFTPVKWIEKEEKNYRRFPIKNQNGSGMCVGFATSTMLGIENHIEENRYLDISALDIYDRRNNKPQEGMWFQNALDIASKFGACTGDLLPYQNLTERQANLPVIRTSEMLNVAQKYKASAYVALPLNIDSIASIINQGKAVLLGFRFNYEEWTDTPYIATNNPKLHHAVAGVDFTLWKGEKCIVIQDSWGEFFGLKGLRRITQKFLNARCTYAGYLIDQPNEIVNKKPKHTFIKGLRFGMMNDNDVKALQEILRYEGLFNFPESTGNYLQITAKSVYDLQVKYQIASMKELNSLGGRVVGPKTIAWLNTKYS
jgi:hypothetical protein